MPDITLSYTTTIFTPPTLGVVSIAGNLDGRHVINVGDLVTQRKNIKKAILDAINLLNPDIVGLSAMTFQYPTALKIAQFIKKHFPEISIALGGYHATLMYREIAESKDARYFDLIFRGEADLSFNEAINAIEDGKSLSLVKGLSFKVNGKFYHNEKRDLEDLKKIKLPDRTKRFWKNCNILNVPFDMVEFSRGCLMSCKFCCIRQMYGKSFRTFDIQRVIMDIENAKNAGIKLLFFTDDNITMEVDRFEELCDAIIRNNHNDVLYAVQASARGIASSPQLVKKMAQAGFKMVFLGIESSSKAVLDYLNKGDILEKSKQAVSLLQKNNILISAGLIIGNPDDDYESMEETFKFARELGVDFIGVQFLVPYPKTEIREELISKGLLVNSDQFRFYNGGTACARTNFLDQDELKFIKFRLTREYFKTRKISVLKAFIKSKGAYRKFLKGIIKLIPEWIIFSLLRKSRKLLLSEQKLFQRYLAKVKKLNSFNID